MNKKNLKVTLTFLILGFGVSLISAGYFFGYLGNINGNVIGGNVDSLNIILDFEDFVLNVTEGAVIDSQELILQNPNGEINLSVLFEVNKTLLDENCTDYLNDCEVLIYKDSLPLINGDEITLTSGSNSFLMNSSCVARSCLQNLDVTFELTE